MRIGGRQFENYTYVMAIVNLTPDSFFAPSRAGGDEVLFRVERAIKEGAAIIDIGAQSTRPGYSEIPPEEEIARLEKPVYEIKRNFDIPLSVDTYFEKSARAALELGADMINDIWGLSHDENMAATIANFGASACIMHNSKTPLSGNIWAPIDNFLNAATNKALAAGIEKDKILIDGGIGFAKTKEQNFELMENYERLNKLGYSTLLGVSRKSMFGGRVEDRLPHTVEATRLACRKGVLFVRVHDVKENFEAIREVYGG